MTWFPNFAGSPETAYERAVGRSAPPRAQITEISRILTTPRLHGAANASSKAFNLPVTRNGTVSLPPAISIVDNDESMRNAISRFVRSHGYVADTFSSAAEFLSSPQIDTTSCVIADVQMPNMNGMEL
jgi:PleD family two-component response regulator